MSHKAVEAKTDLIQRLDVFVGVWRMEGTAFKSPFGPAGRVSAIETLEWLKGRQFLVHNFLGHLDKKDIACIEIFGLNPSGEEYLVHSFYNDGNQRVWHLVEKGSHWILTGDWEVEDRSFDVRCTMTFIEPDFVEAKWEFSWGDAAWKLFWDTQRTRESR